MYYYLPPKEYKTGEGNVLETKGGAGREIQEIEATVVRVAVRGSSLRVVGLHSI